MVKPELENNKGSFNSLFSKIIGDTVKQSNKTKQELDDIDVILPPPHFGDDDDWDTLSKESDSSNDWNEILQDFESNLTYFDSLDRLKLKMMLYTEEDIESFQNIIDNMSNSPKKDELQMIVDLKFEKEDTFEDALENIEDEIPLGQITRNLYDIGKSAANMKQSLGYYTPIMKQALYFGRTSCDTFSNVIKWMPTILNRYIIATGIGMTVGTTLPGVIGALIVFWSFNQFYDKFIKEYVKTFIVLLIIGMFVITIAPYKTGYTKPHQLRHQVMESGENMAIVCLQLGGNSIKYVSDLVINDNQKEIQSRILGLFSDYLTENMGDYKEMFIDGSSDVLELGTTSITNQLTWW